MATGNGNLLRLCQQTTTRGYFTKTIVFVLFHQDYRLGEITPTMDAVSATGDNVRIYDEPCNEEELLLMFLFASVMVVNLALEVFDSARLGEAEGVLSTVESICESWEKTIFLSHILTKCGIDAEHVSEWVRERSLVWWDYFLSTAYEEERWVRIIRMPKHIFLQLVSDLAPRIGKQDTRFRKAVPVEIRVGACLYRMATNASYFLIGDRFGIEETTAKECIPEVIDAIDNVLARQHITWPIAHEMERVSAVFPGSLGSPTIRVPSMAPILELKLHPLVLMLQIS